MPTVEVDGRSIHYLAGPSGLAPGRRTVIFVHGAGGNAMVWQGQRRGLDRGVNTILLDLPGHGKSPGKGCSSIAEYSHWLLRFIQCLGLEEVIIAGHSMGGAVVLEAATRRPEHLNALVLIGSGARLRVNPTIFQGLERDFAATAKELVRQCYGPKSSEKLVNWGLVRLLEERPEVILDDFRACNDFDLLDRGSSIQQPTLVVCGSEDRMTPMENSHSLANNLPKATIAIIEGAGHMAMVERPGKVNTAILKFLASF